MTNKTPGTVPPSAPEPKPIPVKPAYRPKTIEREGVGSSPVSRRYPNVRGGICEYCGVLDKNLPSEHQYRLCPHFRDFGQLRCSYCDETKDPNDIIGHSVLEIAEHPDNPDKLVVWCNSFSCSEKHLKRFQRSRQ